MSSIQQAKAALREQLRAEAARHTAEERDAGSRAICERVAAQEVWQRARSILVFAALPGEPDLETLANLALQAGKTLTLPRYRKDATYEACQVSDLAGQLEKGQFGILEPCRECPVVPLNKLDLVLVPGIGYALNGCRLGRGRGHIDRMLVEVQGWKCGVAFDWQITPEIPTEQHDIRVDSIVTPTRWHVAVRR